MLGALRELFQREQFPDSGSPFPWEEEAFPWDVAADLLVDLDGFLVLLQLRRVRRHLQQTLVGRAATTSQKSGPESREFSSPSTLSHREKREPQLGFRGNSPAQQCAGSGRVWGGSLLQPFPLIPRTRLLDSSPL